jgi:hypothetical protein
MTSSDLERLRSHARAIARELLPVAELLSLTTSALEGLLADLSITEMPGTSGNQAALVRTAAIDMAITAMHIAAGAEKLLLLEKLAALGEPSSGETREGK